MYHTLLRFRYLSFGNINHRIENMQKKALSFSFSILILCFTCVGQTAASQNQPAQNTDLVSEYSKHMGFAKKQVLDVSICEQCHEGFNQ